MTTTHAPRQTPKGSTPGRVRLSKSAISRFVVWTPSVYNELKKAQVVALAHRMLAARSGRQVFSCGNYSERHDRGGGGDYLVDGARLYIAKGKGEWDPARGEWDFTEEERVEFEPPPPA